MNGEPVLGHIFDNPVHLLQPINLTLFYEGQTDEYPLPDKLASYMNVERWRLR